MDFRETADLLGYIVEAMVRRNAPWLLRHEIIALIDEYYNSIGIKRVSTFVLSSLLDASVFAANAESIGFKYSLLYSYFTAYRMKEHGEFRDFILERGRCASFIHEIDLYCGLSRRDFAALTTIAGHYDAAFSQLDEQVRKLADAKNLVGLKLPHEEKLEDFTEEFAKAFGEPEERRDDRKSFENAPVSTKQFRQSLARKPVEDAVVAWICALRVYSVYVKNLEIIEANEKQYHLDKVLEGWARLTALAVTLVGICSEGKEVQFGDWKIKINLKEVLSGEVLRLILMYLPSFVAGFVRADLGSQKLSQQLIGANVDGNHVANLFRTGLLTSMKIEGFLKALRGYIHKVGSDRYLLGAMGWHMRDIFLRFGFSQDEESAFRRIIAEIEADRRGLRGSERDRFVSRETLALSKRKLVETIRE
jgi:hypothetical protein